MTSSNVQKLRGMRSFVVLAQHISNLSLSIDGGITENLHLDLTNGVCIVANQNCR